MLPHSSPSRATFSAETTDRLAEALRRHAVDGSTSELDQLLELMCAEAHASRLAPETIIIAMRRTWERLPRPERVPPEVWSRAYYAVVSRCLTLYFEQSR